jgi:hypothetical protein
MCQRGHGGENERRGVVRNKIQLFGEPCLRLGRQPGIAGRKVKLDDRVNQIKSDITGNETYLKHEYIDAPN